MSASIVIEGIEVGDSTECFVIAEIGHNHQGDLEQAKAMFTAAKECGAHAAKLQKRDNRSLYTRDFFNRPYDSESSFGATYGEHREALEFGRDEYQELQRHARELGLVF
ncbi:MAG: sialic acid synthase, partial [Gaiellaceae bacterium]|nr:sialic acid synthase [Gaiellaceae bacterium]